MTYPVSLSTLLLRARQRTNLEGSIAFLSDAEAADLVSTSYAKWYDLVRATTWGQSLLPVTSYSFQTTGGTSLYPIPSDFLSLVSIDFSLGAGNTISMRPYQVEARNQFNQWPVGGWTFAQPVYYQRVGQSYNFIPTPQGQYQITLNYTPAPAQLSDLGASIDSVSGWEEFIVLDVAMKMATKASLFDLVQILGAEREAEQERITKMADQGDQNAAEIVHDVSGSWDWDY